MRHKFHTNSTDKSATIVQWSTAQIRPGSQQATLQGI